LPVPRHEPQPNARVSIVQPCREPIVQPPTKQQVGRMMSKYLPLFFALIPLVAVVGACVSCP
jgi:hypothetical protein